jgi:hypothetical protein
MIAIIKHRVSKIVSRRLGPLAENGFQYPTLNGQRPIHSTISAVSIKNAA